MGFLFEVKKMTSLDENDFLYRLYEVVHKLSIIA